MKTAKPKRKYLVCPHPLFHFSDVVEKVETAECGQLLTRRGCHQDSHVDHLALGGEEAMKEVRRLGKRFCGRCFLICAPRLFLSELGLDWRPTEQIAEDHYAF